MRRSIVALSLSLLLPLPALAGSVTVKEGETLSEIADRVGVPMSRLMQLNNVSDPDLVEAGRVLKIPGGSSGSGSARGGSAGGGGKVTVQSGETLSEIADRHGMSVNQLMAINGLSNADHVEAGQTLRVSGRVTSASGRPSASSSSYRRGASEHVVRSGESLSTIADGYGVPMSRLVAINGISDPDLVQEGTRLKLTGSPAPRPAAPRPAAPRPAAVTPRPAPQAAAQQPRPAQQPTAQPRPAAQPSPQVAAAPLPATSGLATTPGSGRPDWRPYGPLQVDWANWQPMGGSMVAPTLNGEGQTLYLAVNCTARKLNATSQAGQWKTWDDPQADFEQQLVNDLCKARS
ncbi:MAG: LysM peptidoglycan-binding domain-containing protein [Cyanobium sp.]